jgi:hypothetical protein
MALSGREGRLAQPPPAVAIRHQDAMNLRCNKNYNLIRRKATPRNIVYAQQFSRNLKLSVSLPRNHCMSIRLLQQAKLGDK